MLWETICWKCVWKDIFTGWACSKGQSHLNNWIPIGKGKNDLNLGQMTQFGLNGSNVISALGYLQLTLKTIWQNLHAPGSGSETQGHQ